MCQDHLWRSTICLYALRKNLLFFLLKSSSTGHTLISIKESPGAQWPLLQTPRHLAHSGVGDTESQSSFDALSCAKDWGVGGIFVENQFKL